MNTREIKIRIPDDDLVEKKFRYLASKYVDELRAGKLFDYWEKARLNEVESKQVFANAGEAMVRWKQLGGTIYEVSDDGRVRNFVTGRELKPHFNHGYKRVMLDTNVGGKIVKNALIHRLVALLFIPNPENKPQVNHKDLNRANNHVNNLEWVDAGENCKWNYKKAAQERGYLLNLDIGWGLKH